MMPSIDMLLCRWGVWAIAQARREAGFASVSPMFRDTPSGRGFGSEIPNGVGCWDHSMGDIDRAVVCLPSVLRCVVVQHYQMQSSVRDTAMACGISNKSVSQYLDRAHGLIAEHLDMCSMGA